MRILVTNDDGIHAPGLKAIVEAAANLGKVKVVAPDRERSACGHAMTMRDPLRVNPVPLGLCEEAYEINGLPVDCVNVGLSVCWPDGCDLVLSGVNRGPNLGFDITYSGTAAGAMEGAINGIPSIAVSCATFVYEAPPHFETCARWLKETWPLLLGLEVPKLSFLNVNIPSIAFEEVRGHRFARMGKRVYEDRVELRTDPWGRPYYWQGGVVVMNSAQPGTDVEAVSDGFVAITPISLDWTDEGCLSRLQQEVQSASRK